MGRSAHRQLQKMLSDRRDKVTDQQLFTSRAMSSVLEDIAAVQTRRYTNARVYVKLVWSNKEWLAYTNNAYIRINAKLPFYTNLDRKTRYELIVGLFAHELGHILFSDFEAISKHIKHLKEFHWYPSEPQALSKWSGKENARKLEQWLRNADANPEERVIRNAVFRQCVSLLHNVLEDGHIEDLILRKYPGKLGKCLEVTREYQIKDSVTVSEMLDSVKDGDTCAYQMYQDMMLTYAKFGTIKYGEATANTPCVRKLFSLMDAIDNAVNVYSSDARCAGVNEILLTLWTEIEEYLEKQVAAYKKQLEAGGETDASDFASSAMPNVGSTAPTGTGTPTGVGQLIRENTGGSHNSLRQNTATALKAAAEAASKADVDQSDDSESNAVESQEDTAQAGESQEEVPAQSTVAQDNQNVDDSATDDLDADAAESQEDAQSESTTAQSNLESSSETDDESTDAVSDSNGDSGTDADALSVDPIEQEHSNGASSEEQGRMKHGEGFADPANGDGETTYNDNYEASPYENAASDIDRILSGVAEDMLEAERCVNLNDELGEMDLTEIHSGCNIRINRQPCVDSKMIDLYNQSAPPLLAISKQLQRNIAKSISDRRTGTKMTGLIYGRRMEARNLSRTDGKVFCKRSLPDDTPLMSVALLMDESGSMQSEDRITYARAAAIILQDFCAGLDIPFMCYGHSTSYGKKGAVELYSYCEFDQIDRNDKYRLMDAQARGSNRDGAALRYIERKLVVRPEPTKLLILISDGQPADWGYSGEFAEQDLRQIKNDLRRDGIIFVAAAIGSDRQVIESIYGDSYLDISDLRKLPVTLTQLVKRHIRL